MDKRYKVVITDFIADSLEVEKEIIGDTAEVIALNATNEKDLEGKIEDADAIIVYHTIGINDTILSGLSNCKLIVRAGVGFDNVDHSYARSRNIAVANIPDYGSEDVADTAIGMMLSLTRAISLLNSRLREGLGEWSYNQVKPLTRLRNMNIGIVGLGRIGTATALRAKAFGMNVIFYDPYKQDGCDKALGITRAESLSGLLKQVKVVSLHCPLTNATRHLINSDSIKQLPPGGYVINTSRGAVVDTSAVANAIETGHLAGAAIDVLEQEPPIDDALVQAWKDPTHPAYHKVIINPHSAFYTEEGLKEIRVKSAQACLGALQGEQIRNVVN